MNKINIIYLVIAAFALALTSCSDTGPLSIDDKSMKNQIECSTNNEPENTDDNRSVKSDSHVRVCPSPTDGQVSRNDKQYVLPADNNFTVLEVTSTIAATVMADTFPGSVL